jgi:integrase
VANNLSWVFRYIRDGKAHNMGLGPLELVSFSEAKDKALEQRRLLFAGGDPLEHSKRAKQERKHALRASTAGGVTLRAAAMEYIESNAAGWRNGSTSGSAREWRASLEADAFPLFGSKPAADISVTDVKASLGRIVDRGALESAHRFRARLEAILARANHENPAYANPAASEHLLPPRKGNKVVEHHASLPYSELPKFMRELRAEDSILARALEFAILAGSRSAEVREAKWSEVDMASGTWRISGERMKSGRPHAVPLCERAVALLATMPRDGKYIFPSAKLGAAIGKNSFEALIDRLGYKGKATPHGFRATFKTWASETTNAPAVVVEMAIAHKIGGKLEAAYQRGELLAKRRELMDQWCKYCSGLKLPRPRQSSSPSRARRAAQAIVGLVSRHKGTAPRMGGVSFSKQDPPSGFRTGGVLRSVRGRATSTRVLEQAR